MPQNTARMLHTHPNPQSLFEQDALAGGIDACFGCGNICLACADACQDLLGNVGAWSGPLMHKALRHPVDGASRTGQPSPVPLGAGTNANMLDTPQLSPI